jgi:hypothetical protein
MEPIYSNPLFGEYMKLIKPFKLPHIDANAVLESRRKDIEALAAAQTAALSGMQSLGQKQMEILSATITRLQARVAQQGVAQGKPAEGEAVQQSLHKALMDMQELAHTAYRVQADSYAVISKRVAEKVEEFKALLQPTR